MLYGDDKFQEIKTSKLAQEKSKKLESSFNYLKINQQLKCITKTMPCQLVLQLTSIKHFLNKTSTLAQVIPENKKEFLNSFYVAKMALIPKTENGPTKKKK